MLAGRFPFARRLAECAGLVASSSHGLGFRCLCGLEVGRSLPIMRSGSILDVSQCLPTVTLPAKVAAVRAIAKTLGRSVYRYRVRGQDQA